MENHSDYSDEADISILIRVSSFDSPIRETLDDLDRQVFGKKFQIVIVRHEQSEVRGEALSRDYPELIFKEVTYDSDFSYGRALNLGIEAVSSEVVILLSEHCRPISESWISQLVDALCSNEDCAGVWGPLLFSYGATNSIGKDVQKNDLSSFLKRPNTGLQNSNAALRRSLWQRHQFSESLAGCEDQEWAFHFLREGWKTAKVDAASVLYIVRQSPLAYAKKIYREYLIVAELVGYPPRLSFRDLALGFGSVLRGLLNGRMKISISLKMIGGLTGGYLANVTCRQKRNCSFDST